MKRFLPLGVRLLSSIYLINAILYILSLLLFYNRILVVGQEVNKVIAWVVRLALIAVPIYLFFRLKYLKKDAWVLAIYFHLFFIINNSLAILEQSGFLNSLIRITGQYG